VPQPTTSRRRAAVALAVALVVAAAGCDSPEPGSGPDVPDLAVSSSTSTPAFDLCVLGSWTVTRATSTEFVDDDRMEFTNDGGAVWRFNPDGTGEYDFGRGTTYAADHKGERVTFVYHGKVTFRFTTKSVGRQLELVDRRAGAESGVTVTVGGKSVSVDFGVGDDSVSYRCADNSLELIDEVKTLALRRT
jgi:hypothetical protein